MSTITDEETMGKKIIILIPAAWTALLDFFNLLSIL